jgi:hypothetical protein
MKRIVLTLCLAGSLACASVPVKQQAVMSLQASETALETAHDMERSLCFTTPPIETGGHCTNPLAPQLGLTDTVHQQLAKLFSRAFEYEGKAALVLQTWRAGDPVPTSVSGYQKDITDILALANTLLPGPQTQAFLAKTKEAVDAGAKIAVAVGVKP